jgi:hypothetical protein
MKRAFVTISLGALVALSPLAAMAQSEGSPQPLKVAQAGTAHAGGGGSHSRQAHAPPREHAQGEGARGSGIYAPDAYGARGSEELTN